MYYKILKLSVYDIIVSQKGSNGEEKLHFFGRDDNFTNSLCSKLNLLGKDTKPMETTVGNEARTYATVGHSKGISS